MTVTDLDLAAARAVGRRAQDTHPPSDAVLARVAAIASDAATAAPSTPSRGAAIGTPGRDTRPARASHPAA